MKEALNQKKILFFTSAYFTNVNYLIVLVLLSIFLSYEKNPYLSLVIWGVPAIISVIVSTLIIKSNLSKNQTKEQGMLKLAIAHFPSLMGLMGAFIYLFMYA